VHSPKVTSSDGGKHYTVNIADIAQQWVRPNALNLGVAISDNPANTSTVYQLVFGPATALSHLTASVTYRPSAQPGPIVAGGGASSAASPPPAASAPAVATGPPPPIPVASPPSGQPAQVAAPPAPVVAPPAPTVALALKAAGSAPPFGFWIALVLILLLLGATTVVLADPSVSPTQTPDRGVARALRARLSFTPRLQEPK
jgi:hypothetical protein